MLQPVTAGQKSRRDHVPSGFRSPYASRGLGLQRIQMRPPMADQEQLARPFWHVGGVCAWIPWNELVECRAKTIELFGHCAWLRCRGYATRI